MYLDLILFRWDMDSIMCLFAKQLEDRTHLPFHHSQGDDDLHFNHISSTRLKLVGGCRHIYPFLA